MLCFCFLLFLEVVGVDVLLMIFVRVLCVLVCSMVVVVYVDYFVVECFVFMFSCVVVYELWEGFEFWFEGVVVVVFILFCVDECCDGKDSVLFFVVVWILVDFN